MIPFQINLGRDDEKRVEEFDKQLFLILFTFRSQGWNFLAPQNVKMGFGKSDNS